MFVYFCFCEVQLSCTNSLYLMQLDFKLKNERKEKENLLCTICLFLLFWNCNKCLFSEYYCLSSRHNVSALLLSFFFFFFQLVYAPFKKRVNCIVDSTVSSLYQNHLNPNFFFPPVLFLIVFYFCKWFSVHAQIIMAKSFWKFEKDNLFFFFFSFL